MKKTKPGNPASKVSRGSNSDQFYEQWRHFVVQLYGNGGMIPTLDYRSCLAIDLIKQGGVVFCVTSMMVRHRRFTEEEAGNFFFTKSESRAVFRRYHRLKEEFGRSARPILGRAKHLCPETWTGPRPHGWARPFSAEDIDLAIASLIAYWDACAAKFPVAQEDDRKGKRCRDRDEGFWNLKPLPKLARLQGLPVPLAREVRKHAKDMMNPMQAANPPVELA
jgi:hypothetical protein